MQLLRLEELSSSETIRTRRTLYWETCTQIFAILAPLLCIIKKAMKLKPNNVSYKERLARVLDMQGIFYVEAKDPDNPTERFVILRAL